MLPSGVTYADRFDGISGSAIRAIFKVLTRPSIISFAGGNPSNDALPNDICAELSRDALLEDGKRILQYGATEGYVPLRQMISRHSIRSGMQVDINNILITTGSQQALDLLGKIFVNRGDRILVESPTYLGALQAWNAYGAEYISVPVDEYGMRTDLLEDALRIGPKFIYVLPNFQNPTGTTLPLERRMK